MYNIKFTYRPIATVEGREVAEIETSVKCENTCESELRALGVGVNRMIEQILTGVPNDAKLIFAKEACRYMMANIKTK